MLSINKFPWEVNRIFSPWNKSINFHNSKISRKISFQKIDNFECSYQIIDNLWIQTRNDMVCKVHPTPPHPFWPSMTFSLLKLKSLCLFFCFLFDTATPWVKRNLMHWLDLESEPPTGLATSLYSRPFHNSKVNFLATIEGKKWKKARQNDKKIWADE